MGLYSVFLAVGQIVGSFIGGWGAEISGVDGLLVASALAYAVAVVRARR